MYCSTVRPAYAEAVARAVGGFGGGAIDRVDTLAAGEVRAFDVRAFDVGSLVDVDAGVSVIGGLR